MVQNDAIIVPSLTKTTAWMQKVEQRMEQLPRDWGGIFYKSPLDPPFSKGEVICNEILAGAAAPQKSKTSRPKTAGFAGLKPSLAPAGIAPAILKSRYSWPAPPPQMVGTRQALVGAKVLAPVFTAWLNGTTGLAESKRPLTEAKLEGTAK